MACAVALPLGMMIGRLPFVRHLLDPTLQVLWPIPVTAWLPLAMIVFGLGPRSAVPLVFLCAFYPILINTIFGARSVDPRSFEAASMLGCEGTAQFFKVVLPASMPAIFTGLRLGLGFAWVVIVVDEMTGVQTGLGAIITEARQLSRIEIVISGMIVIGIAGFISDRLVMMAGRRLLRWSPNNVKRSDPDSQTQGIDQAIRVQRRPHRCVARGPSERQQGRVRLSDRRIRLRQVDVAPHRRRF